MKPDATEQDCPLEIALRAVPSTLQTGGGRKIPFERANLVLHNPGHSTVEGILPHVTLTQEGGPAHDGTDALSQTRHVTSLLPGDTVTWDVYDLLCTANAGLASKVHLFGYKAILNWWFELIAWAEYRLSDDASPRHSPTSRWKLRWNAVQPPRNAITLSIDIINNNQ